MMDRKIKIGIIGAGKVGVSLSFVMLKKGFNVVAISDNEQDALNNAHRYLGSKGNIIFTKDNFYVLKLSDVIILAIQDRLIKDVAGELYSKAEKLIDKVIVHTCGSLASDVLKPLDEKGAMLGVIHPLQTFPDIESAIKVIPETYFFIEASGKAKDILGFIGKKIGKETVFIKGQHMVLYHLSAVFVCNLLCALLYLGESIMKNIDIELAPFFPIIKATLNNIEKKGPLYSLTGPIVRGDVETVLSHLKAIEDEKLIKLVYKDLSMIAARMAKERKAIDEKTYKKIEEILRKD
ncbi:MAG TPA: DUF2520 domain-containing protein [Syntrophorhabdaceae bacterium]|nr:DUF2520 domain-containing protein [Syntrophorhabdaceae bacterium]